MNLKNIIIIVLLITPCFSNNSPFAQGTDFSLYNIEQRNQIKSIVGPYQKLNKSTKLAYKSYLESYWDIAYTILSPSMYEKEKKVLNNKKPISAKKRHIIDQLYIYNAKKIANLNNTKLILKPVKKDPSIECETLQLNYCNTYFSFDIPKKLKNINLLLYDEESIANYWYKVPTKDVEYLIDQILYNCNKKRINDWGLIEITNIISNMLFDDKNEQIFFSWLLFGYMNYDIKLGRWNHELYLLYHFNEIIFEKEYVVINGKPYYSISEPLPSAIETYYNDFNYEIFAFDLSFTESPLFNEDLEKKNYNFIYNDKLINLDLHINKSLIEFFKNYPSCHIKIGLNSIISESLSDDLARDIIPIIKNMTDKEKINFLLYLTNTITGYKLDQFNFKKQKQLFPDEYLFYDYSDCEDKVIFFVALVRLLTDIPTIATIYNNHIATALQIRMVRGVNTNYLGLKYYLADPSYPNTKVGFE